MLFLCAVTVSAKVVGEDFLQLPENEALRQDPEATALRFFAVLDTNPEDASQALQGYCEEQKIEIFESGYVREFPLDDLPPKLRKSLPKGKGLVNDLQMFVGIEVDDEKHFKAAAELVLQAWISAEQAQ